MSSPVIVGPADPLTLERVLAQQAGDPSVPAELVFGITPNDAATPDAAAGGDSTTITVNGKTFKVPK